MRAQHFAAAEFAAELERLELAAEEEHDQLRDDDAGERNTGPERLPLFPLLPPAEPYPINALGPILAEAVEAISRKVQAPPAIVAQSVLGVASLAAQAVADVRMPYGQRRPLSLFLLSIAGTGERKTSSDREALRPVTRRENDLQESYARAHQDWIIEHAAWAAERKKVESNRKLGFADRKAHLTDLGPEPLPPLHPVLTSAEPTFEGLVKNWPGLHPSLGLFASEGGGFIGGFNMAAENRLRTAAGFSLVWDGAPITRVRALDGVSILKGRRLALHLMVQPEAAAGFLSDPVLRDQGLHSRILPAAPDSIAGTRLYRSACLHGEEQIRRYHERLLSMLEAHQPVPEDRAQGLTPREMPMSTAAETFWCTFYNEVEIRCGARGDLHPIRDFAAKAAEHAARIAGVLAIVANKHAPEINGQTMADAIELTTWYLSETRRLQTACRTDPKLVQAEALLTWMRGQPNATCKLRDLLRLGPNTTRTKKDAEGALDILKAHGWVEEVAARPRTFRAYPEEAAHG